MLISSLFLNLNLIVLDTHKGALDLRSVFIRHPKNAPEDKIRGTLLEPLFAGQFFIGVLDVLTIYAYGRLIATLVNESVLSNTDSGVRPNEGDLKDKEEDYLVDDLHSSLKCR